MRYFREINEFVREKIEEHKETFDPNHIQDMIDLCIQVEYSQGNSKGKYSNFRKKLLPPVSLTTASYITGADPGFLVRGGVTVASRQN